MNYFQIIIENTSLMSKRTLKILFNTFITIYFNVNELVSHHMLNKRWRFDFIHIQKKKKNLINIWLTVCGHLTYKICRQVVCLNAVFWVFTFFFPFIDYEILMTCMRLYKKLSFFIIVLEILWCYRTNRLHEFDFFFFFHF